MDMARSMEELQTGLDASFKKVVADLQGLFITVAGKLQGRATHTWGAAAKGHARIIVPFDFPDNPFFQFGKEYGVLLRHASPGPQEDSRYLDGAAASIKFFENSSYSGDGAHDILMNTGRILFVRSARQFWDMVHTDPKDKPARKALVENGTVLDNKLTEGYRTGSFTEFYYHAQISFEMNDSHYIRYRMIPGDRGPERGLFPESIRSEGRTTDPGWPDDRRAPDFMRRDFDTRVAHLGVRYILQAQVRPIDPAADVWASRMDKLDVAVGHEPEALDPSVYWDNRYYPWMDVALLHLDTPMTEDEMDTLTFDANRTHSSITLPLATNAKYALPHEQADRCSSFGHSRPLVYYLARKARAESQRPHKN
jgi:hypothetical protein